jgi:hypothetical protein
MKVPDTASLYTSAIASAANLLLRQSQQPSGRAIAEQLQDRICRSVILADPYQYTFISILRASYSLVRKCAFFDWMKSQNVFLLIGVGKRRRKLGVLEALGEATHSGISGTATHTHARKVSIAFASFPYLSGLLTRGRPSTSGVTLSASFISRLGPLRAGNPSPNLDHKRLPPLLRV